MEIIAIDNGVTGTITIIRNDGLVSCCKMPVRKCLDYTKTKHYVTRVDFNELCKILANTFMSQAYIERPMVNPMRWKATISAVRCLESVLLALEICGIGYEFLDSKEWQKVMIPQAKTVEYIDKSGKKRRKQDKAEIKTLAKQIATRMFPKIMAECDEYADSLLMGEYIKRRG